MLERFTADARQMVMLSRDKAAERGDGRIRPAHLLYALVTSDGVAQRVLEELGVTPAKVERELGPPSGPATRAARGPAVGPAAGQPDDAEALKAIGIDIDEIRRKVEENFGDGALDRLWQTPDGPLTRTGRRIALTSEAKGALYIALREARALRHHHIGGEHLLLGLLRVGQRNRFGDFTPARLRALGIDAAAARERILAELVQTQP
ncbi:MAG TPA: Clp protease N-terminal domain-containing protein [Streptosporangiaceae bacterium]